MKLDLVAYAKVIAASGTELASLGLSPAGTVIVTFLGEFISYVLDFLRATKVFQLGLGPQLDFVFPLRVKITKLVAGDESGEEFVYDSLAFDGNTIIATNTSEKKIAVDNVVPMERIGMHFRQTLELPTLDVGVWLHVGVFWVFALIPSHDFHLLEFHEKELDFDLGIKSFNSSMSNSFGEGPSSANPIKFNFID